MVKLLKCFFFPSHNLFIFLISQFFVLKFPNTVFRTYMVVPVSGRQYVGSTAEPNLLSEIRKALEELPLKLVKG